MDEGGGPSVAGEGGRETGGTALGGFDGGGAPPSAGDAGAASTPRPPSPFIPSGTRECENERYCFDLQCYTPRSNLRGVCLVGCREDAECQVGEQCVITDELEGACYRACDSPLDCEYGFDCFDVANERRSFVCFPSKWALALFPR